MECLELSSILDSARLTFEAQARASDIILQADFQEKSAWIYADAVWIHQAIQNVVTSAIKFSTSGEIIRLVYSIAGDKALVSVIDTGIGIPPSELPHITDAFYQAHNVLDRASGGLGFGLAIANGVVKAHGGELKIDTQVGVGTSVTITLPVSPSVRECETASPALVSVT